MSTALIELFNRFELSEEHRLSFLTSINNKKAFGINQFINKDAETITFKFPDGSRIEMEFKV